MSHGTVASEPPQAAEWEGIRRVLTVAVARTCPAWLREDAEDIVQEALIKVMGSPALGEGNGPPAASYLWRVAYSATIDEIRRRRRRREVPMDAETAEREPNTPGASPEDRAVASDLGRGIRDCLGHLSLARRRAVTLRLLGHTVKETATLLGWPFKRTENLVYRGLADLRACLERKGLTP